MLMVVTSGLLSTRHFAWVILRTELIIKLVFYVFVPFIALSSAAISLNV